MNDTMIGVDLAKNVFQVHGASMSGEVRFRKKLTRGQFVRFMSEQPSALVVMEACGGAHHWAREMIDLGHKVKLIAPQYVKPFVKRQKNDAADAEAIVIAARQPEMRFVEPKSPEQQARAVLFRARMRAVHQRTELVNSLRSVLYEYGQVFPIGIGHVKRFERAIEDTDLNIPEIVRDECRDLLAQIVEKTLQIDEKTKKLTGLAKQGKTSQRLQTMPGVGPMIALAVEAFAPAMQTFQSGRHFEA
jgi:transposase